MVHVYTQGNGCTGSVKGESMYLFGEQRQTCLILVNQNTFSILAKKIEGAWVMKWTGKGPSVRKQGRSGEQSK